MANKNNSRQPAVPITDPDEDETIELEDLVSRFADHAGDFQTFKMLQRMFDDYVAAGLLQDYTQEGLQDFMSHFILISEIIFDLESLAAQKVIDKVKAKEFILARPAG